MLTITAGAVEPRYAFHVYSHREGLDNLSVRSIYQDRQGFLWIGTDNGLFRFDGSRFRPFRSEHGLPNAHISAIAESADGKLWVGTRDGIAYLNGERFVEIGVELGASARGPSAFANGPDGRFWFAGDTGLFVWDSRQSPGEPKFRRAELAGMPGIVGTRAVFVDRAGVVWFGMGNRIGRLLGPKLEILTAGEGLPDEDWG